jgi:DNA-binding transcriptional regulator YiaG
MDGPMSKRMEFYIKDRQRLAKPYHLTGIGLPNVYLLNGVEIEDDPDYGQLVTIADIHNLHHAIGFHIATKSEPMTGDEFRFLRKQMQMTQVALASRLRLDVQTVANYEKGKTKNKNIGPADPAMRMIFALHIIPAEVHADFIKGLMDAIATLLPKPKMPELVRRKIAGRWHDGGQRMAA